MSAGAGVWTSHIDAASGRTFYFNMRRGLATWMRPVLVGAGGGAIEIPLSVGWPAGSFAVGGGGGDGASSSGGARAYSPAQQSETAAAAAIAAEADCGAARSEPAAQPAKTESAADAVASLGAPPGK